MAPPAAANPSRANAQASTASPATDVTQVPKSPVTRDFDLTLRAFFPVPTAPAKFNPIHAMQQLLRTMLKDESSLVLRTPTNDKQLILATESLPTREKTFKQFFNVSQPRSERQNKPHICIGCNVLSNRTLGNIKFNSNEKHLMAWLKQARVFIESDSLGTDRPVTIGHFTQISPALTNLGNFHAHLVDQLMLIDMEADTAIELAPQLKSTQLDAMSNGDDFVPILPNFALYKTRLSHGSAPSQISTEVIGVKGAPQDAKLLGEFFARLAAESGTNYRDGVFLPKGAALLLGPQTYANVLKENDVFLNNVATVPVNLEYAAWFAVIDPNNHSETEPISLHEHLLRKPWFLRIESVSRNKCLLVTNHSNLNEARTWIDENLEQMVRRSIPAGIEPPSALLPRRLDKPVHTKTGLSYADILKKQFSLAPNHTTPEIANNRPSRKRQAIIIDYDSDTSSDLTEAAQNVKTSTPDRNTNVVNIHTDQSATVTPDCASMLLELKNEINQLKTIIQPPSNTKTPTVDYAAELESLKRDLQSLRNFITTAVEQLKTEIVSIHAIQAPNEMETDVEHNMDHSPNILDLIAELKQDIAAVVHETRTLFQTERNAFSTFQMTPMPT